MSDDVKALIARLRKYLQAREEVTPQIAGQVFDTVVDLDMGSRGHVRLLASDIALAADALEAAQQAPAVDREALVKLLQSEGVVGGNVVASEIIASGILQDAAEVEARGLEKAADEIREQMIADELAMHDLTYSAELPPNSKIMLNGAQRFMERQFVRAQLVREGNA